MYFMSDNAGIVHPKIMQALADANTGFSAPYGNDPITERAIGLVRDVFEAPDAAVYYVPTGTAANSLALAVLAKPWSTIYCAPKAHIQMDECNAPEFFTGGAKLTLVGKSDKMTPEALAAAIGPDDVHAAQPGPLSITQVTEFGQVYSLDELADLVDVAKAHDLPVHLDGARLANACVALGCSASEMTWKLGIDAVSFGGTKNGCMGVEAVVFFDPTKAREFELRRKRGAHLFSKQRYLAAQMIGYLTDELWLETAELANENCARLTVGLREAGAEFDYTPEANMIFCRLPRAVHQDLMAAGARYYLNDGPLDTGPEDEMLGARLVCDWSITTDLIDQFVEFAKA